MDILTLVISLVVLIFVHELGHLVTAKLCKCKVTEFALGFGKALWSKQIGSTLYKINILPFGGYCKLYKELEYSKSKFAFTNKTYSQKVAISLAGVAVNVITGGIALLIGKHFLIQWLYAFGYYSVVIGLSNLAPIPALDGSFPFFVLLEKKMGKKKAYDYISKLFLRWFNYLMILNWVSIAFLIIYYIIKFIHV